MAPPRPVEILPTPAETNTSHTGRLCEKTLQEHPRSCKALGATPAGALARPHGTAQHLGGKNVTSASIILCRILTGTTAEARGLLSGIAIGSPKKPGETHFLRKQQNRNDHTNHKTRPRQSRHSGRSPRTWRPQRPTRTVGPSTPWAKLYLTRGTLRRTNETPPCSRAGRPLG
jgi:hypothetical protein